MVKKFYFQLQNGNLNCVQVDSIDELREKVKKEFGTDKEEAKKKLQEDIATIQGKIDEIEKKVKNATGKEFLELNCLAAQYRLAIYQNEQELQKVDDMKAPDLVFFELTPIKL